jgi:hypothetical protein
MMNIYTLKGFIFPFPSYHGTSTTVSHYQDFRVPVKNESNHQGFRFPVSKVHSYIHKVPLHLRPNVGVSASVFAFFKTLGFIFTMKTIIKGFGFPVSKLHFISLYPDIYTTKTAAPMKKSWKGNIVDTKLFHHSMSKVHKGNIVDTQVAQKCVFPSPISHWGEWLSSFFISIFSSVLSERLSAYFHIYMWYLPDIIILPVRFFLFIFMLHITLGIFHFSFVFLNNTSCYVLFCMGESDYLYDNLEYRSLFFSNEKKNVIFSFHLFEERVNDCSMMSSHWKEHSFIYRSCL